MKTRRILASFLSLCMFGGTYPNTLRTIKNAINRRFCYIRAVLKPKNSSLSFLPIDLSSELCYNYYNKHIHSGGVP